MKKNSGKSTVLLLISLFGLSACVTTQPALEEASDATLSTTSVADVRVAAADLPVTVRWGGTIVGVENRGDGSTVVELVDRPLSRSGRPFETDRSAGRFRAVFDRFLDPAVYTAGREMTVLGTVGETVEGKVGESEYRFPLLQVARSIYWQPRPDPADNRHRHGHYGYHQHSIWDDDWPFHNHHHHRGSGGYLLIRH